MLLLTDSKITTMSKKQILFRIPEAKAQAFQERAKAQGKSLNQILETFVDGYLSDDISSDSTAEEQDNSSDSTNHQPDNKSDTNIEAFIEALIEEKLKPLEAAIDEQQQEIRELRADYRELKLEQREAKLEQREARVNINHRHDYDCKSNTTKEISGVALAKRLKVSDRYIRKQFSKGEEHFRKWSKTKDPEGLSWNRNPSTKRYYQVADDDQTDCKANPKPSAKTTLCVEK